MSLYIVQIVICDDVLSINVEQIGMCKELMCENHDFDASVHVIFEGWYLFQVGGYNHPTSWFLF